MNSKDYGKVLLDKGTSTSVLWPTAFLYIFSSQVLRIPSPYLLRHLGVPWWGTLNFCLTCSVLRYPKAAIDGKKVVSFEINIFECRMGHLERSAKKLDLSNIFNNEHRFVSQLYARFLPVQRIIRSNRIHSPVIRIGLRDGFLMSTFWYRTKMSPTHKTKNLSYIFYCKIIRIDVGDDIRCVGDRNIEDTFSILIQ